MNMSVYFVFYVDKVPISSERSCLVIDQQASTASNKLTYYY